MSIEHQEHTAVRQSEWRAPDGLPEIILEDEQLRAGLERLSSYKGNVSVDLYLSRHLTSKDLGAAGEFEHTVRTGDYDAIAIEAHGWSHESRALLQRYADPRNTVDAAIIEWVSDFELRMLLVARACGVSLWPCDVQASRESAAGAKMSAMRNDSPVPIQGGDEAIQRFAEYQNAREWYGLAVLGAQLPEEVTEHQRILMIYGSGHGGLAQKLRALGVASEVIRQDPTSSLTAGVARKILQMTGLDENNRMSAA